MLHLLRRLKPTERRQIVNLLDVVSDKGDKGDNSDPHVNLVFEYCDHDLTGIMETNRATPLHVSQIKYYAYNLLSALFTCHKQRMLHRDIKGANVLVSNNGDVKLADFGLARLYKQNGADLTKRVVTLWYRAPELLLGQTKYTSAVDMWSAGCLFGEMLQHGEAMLKGKTELDQLSRIFKLVGTPTEEMWPGVTALPNWSAARYAKVLKSTLRETFAHRVSPQALNLLEALLQLNPDKRITAEKALDHDYFWKEAPPMMKREHHPVYKKHCHEYDHRKEERNRARAAHNQRKLAHAANPSRPQNVPRYPAFGSAATTAAPSSSSGPSRGSMAQRGSVPSRGGPSSSGYDRNRGPGRTARPGQAPGRRAGRPNTTYGYGKMHGRAGARFHPYAAKGKGTTKGSLPHSRHGGVASSSSTQDHKSGHKPKSSASGATGAGQRSGMRGPAVGGSSSARSGGGGAGAGAGGSSGTSASDVRRKDRSRHTQRPSAPSSSSAHASKQHTGGTKDSGRSGHHSPVQATVQLSRPLRVPGVGDITEYKVLVGSDLSAVVPGRSGASSSAAPKAGSGKDTNSGSAQDVGGSGRYGPSDHRDRGGGDRGRAGGARDRDRHRDNRDRNRDWDRDRDRRQRRPDR